MRRSGLVHILIWVCSVAVGTTPASSGLLLPQGNEQTGSTPTPAAQIDIPSASRSGKARGEIMVPGTLTPANPLIRVPRYFSLVIGIDRYEFSPRGTIEFAVSDAQAMSRILSHGAVGLVKPQDMTVLLNEEATAANILKAMDQVTKVIGKGDVFVVYFSGHAMPLPDKSDSQLLAADARLLDNEIASGAVHVVRDIAKTLSASRGRGILITDACEIGPALVKSVDSFAGFSLVSGTSDDQKAFDGYFTRNFVNALQSSAADTDDDGLVSISEAIVLATELMKNDFRKSRIVKQIPSFFGTDASDMALTRAVAKPTAAKPKAAQVAVRYSVDEELGLAIASQPTMSLAGQRLDVQKMQDQQVTFLSNSSNLKQGLNLTSGNLGQRVGVWVEDNRLTLFPPTYGKSFAIIAVVEDYDRAKDPLKRGATGYKAVTGLREQAAKLRETLIGLGFPAAQILMFEDAAVTSENLDKTLGEFWAGGKYANADRLLFYFAGHGDVAETSNAGFLVTYDFDRKRPTRSALLMKDLSSRHFEHIQAKHVVVMLEACSSGLALQPTFLSEDFDIEKAKRFRKLSVVSDEVTQRARNILVAGTGQQRAAAPDGGIFTQKLIRGLQGEGDLNHDGVIQFDELALYVKEEVRAAARELNVVQVPDYFIARKNDGGQGGLSVFIPSTAFKQ
ncbi:caspase family protein [Variovorax sp. J22R133]|uniref:caspase family protein n=1 Tax=Variovorax brevis TaxID=3053503 RepID=UPI002578F00E|nr:caspase family protein [Variovorax sp. J22R133]MDM0118074.1 caspase family protein [Variovorax sp. J22R133]